MAFPKDFVWGAATSSYQIEGAIHEDGRSASVWDVFSAWPGKTFNGETGDRACGHYYKYKEDVALMKEMGLQAYRFSIAWPRIYPDAFGTGYGSPNQKGLDFYSRLVDELLAVGITPWATLFHWDMPQSLFREGGWLNPRIADAFAQYSYAMANTLGDRVTNWMTFNEPQCFIGLGLESGIHAPGMKMAQADLVAAHHCHLVAHGKAVDSLRSVGGDRFNIGYVPTSQALIPATEDPALVEAVKKTFFSYIPKHGYSWTMAAYTDPLFLGTYPEDWLAVQKAFLPKNWEKDLENVVGKTDFCGINLYSGMKLQFASEQKKSKDGLQGLEIVKQYPGNPKTAIKWDVEPETLRWVPRFLWERYKKPIVIAENGLSNSDWVSIDGKVHDPARIDFTNRYLLELEKAIEDGVDVSAYFHWSLMDNFEWAEGYRDRFGLVYVDFPSGKRILKDSAYWYRDVIASNGKNLH